MRDVFGFWWLRIPLLIAVSSSHAAPPSIYLLGQTNDNYRFVRFDLHDHSTHDLIVDDQASASDIAVDPVNDLVYWADRNAGTIHRRHSDGSQREVFLSDLGGLRGIAVDAVGQKLYWSERDYFRIRRCNFDGSNVETVTSLGNPYSAAYLAIDGLAGKLYWTDQTLGQISWCNLDGTDVEAIVTLDSTSQLSGLAVDVAAGRIYWTELAGNIAYANLDGTGATSLNVEHATQPIDVDIDPTSGKLFFTNAWTPRGIVSANLDGSNSELIRDESGLGTYLSGITVDSTRGRVYWSNYGMRSIRSIGVDGQGFDYLVANTLGTPNGLQIDPESGMMFWVEYLHLNFFRLARAQLDGSNIQELYTDYGHPRRLALDHDAGVIYWPYSFYSSGGFWRCSVDGTDSEVLAEHWSEYWPLNVILDASAQKLYWPGREYWTGQLKIWRCNVDTTGIEDIVTSDAADVTYDECSGGFALDLDQGKMYWTEGDFNHGRIMRAGLNGEGLEELVTGEFCSQDIVLDAPAGKFYWTDTRTGTMQRANLDGSDVELLPPTGLDAIHGITLDFRTISGDCDRDGVIALEDLANLAVCLGGPFNLPAAGCSCQDTDLDGNVDLADLVEFQNRFGQAGQ